MPLDHFPQTQNKILSRLQVAGATNGPSLGATHEDFLVKLEDDGTIDETFFDIQALADLVLQTQKLADCVNVGTELASANTGPGTYDISTQIAAQHPTLTLAPEGGTAGNSETRGWSTETPNNVVIVKNDATKDDFVDSSGDKVYGRLTHTPSLAVAGTIDVTLGSTTIDFSVAQAFVAGDAVELLGVWYEISAVNSATSYEIFQPYVGGTATIAATFAVTTASPGTWTLTLYVLDEPTGTETLYTGLDGGTETLELFPLFVYTLEDFPVFPCGTGGGPPVGEGDQVAGELGPEVTKALVGLNYISNAGFQNSNLVAALGSLIGIWAESAGSPTITAPTFTGSTHGVNVVEFTTLGDAVAVRVRLPAREATDYAFSLNWATTNISEEMDVDISIEDETQTARQVIPTETFSTLAAATFQKSEFTFQVDPTSFTAAQIPTFATIVLTAADTTTTNIDAVKLEPGIIASSWTPDTSVASTIELGEVILAPLGDDTNDEGNRVPTTDDPRFVPGIGGQNFIPDAGFAQTNFAMASTVGRWWVDAGTATIGGENLEAPRHGGFILNLQPAAGVRMRLRLPSDVPVVDQPNSYVFSVWANSGAGDDDLDVNITILNAAGAVLETPVADTFVPPTGSWQRFSSAFSVDPTLANVSTFVEIHLENAGGGSVDEMELDLVQLELGATANPWIPGPSLASSTEYGLTILGTLSLAVTELTSVDSPYAVIASDAVISADASGGAITVDLPPVSDLTGRTLLIKRTNAGGNAVTVDADGADLIDGSGTNVLNVQWEAITLVSDGTDWLIF